MPKSGTHRGRYCKMQTRVGVEIVSEPNPITLFQNYCQQIFQICHKVLHYVSEFPAKQNRSGESDVTLEPYHDVSSWIGL